jgi:hypothetical protein
MTFLDDPEHQRFNALLWFGFMLPRQVALAEIHAVPSPHACVTAVASQHTSGTRSRTSTRQSLVATHSLACHRYFSGLFASARDVLLWKHCVTATGNLHLSLALEGTNASPA